MVTARPWAIKNLKLQADGSYRFTAVILKSTGQTDINGCRWTADKQLHMPSFRLGTNWVPMVINSDNDRALLKRLVVKAIAEQVKADLLRKAQDAL